MNRNDIEQALIQHLVEERLEGDGSELAASSTPLLAWGVLDSLGVVGASPPSLRSGSVSPFPPKRSPVRTLKRWRRSPA